MKYTLKGSLQGAFFSGLLHPLTNKKIRIYSILKYTDSDFHLAITKDLKKKEGDLLGEGLLDGSGRFSIELDQYNGGPVEIDWYCDGVPVFTDAKKRTDMKLQFHIARLLPLWNVSRSEDQVAAFNYIIPAKWFSAILRLYDLSTLCGKVNRNNTARAC